jgi:hypothetical protein
VLGLTELLETQVQQAMLVLEQMQALQALPVTRVVLGLTELLETQVLMVTQVLEQPQAV